MHAVSSIITFEGKQEKIVQWSPKEGRVYYSLPLFFKMKDPETRHGLVLKPLFANFLQNGSETMPSGEEEAADDAELVEELDDEESGDAAESNSCNVLLVSAVDREYSIPARSIQPLPRLLQGKTRNQVFAGLYFTEDDGFASKLIAILDPELALVKMLKERE
jgi:hypothetical protein